MVDIPQESRRGVLGDRADEASVPVIQLIEQAIKQTGSIHGAALHLGVNPNTIRYHLRRAGLTVKAVVTVRLERTGEAL